MHLTSGGVENYREGGVNLESWDWDGRGRVWPCLATEAVSLSFGTRLF